MLTEDMLNDRAYNEIPDDFSHRLVYQRLHNTLVSGIESNHFRKDLEAISFVSSLFAYVMDRSFLSEFTKRLREHYNRRDSDAFASKLRIIFGSMMDDVSREAMNIGVSREYISIYFKYQNQQNSLKFGARLASVDPGSCPTESDYLRLCTSELIAFMSTSLDNSKEVTYKRRNMTKVDFLYICLIGAVIMSVLVAYFTTLS